MDSSDDDSFSSHFAALDELVQLIYQGPSKFVVLSSVNDAGWTVHLGLTGHSGRWWKGTWTEKDVDKFVGHTSGKLEDKFAENLAKALVDGELAVGDWSADKGASINLTVGTSAKTPVRIPLIELEPKDAAVYAATMFAEIAFQARDRKCRLHPPAFQPRPYVPSPPRPMTSGVKRKASADVNQDRPTDRSSNNSRSQPPSPHKDKGKGTNKTEPSHVDEQERARAQLEALDTRAATNKGQPGMEPKSKSPSSSSSSKPVAKSAPKSKIAGVARPAKGASLANPSKKARKYQALEFEDD